MRVSTSFMHQHSLAMMLEQQAKLAQAQEQISSGKRITKPSDDPIGNARRITYQQTLGSLSQFESNANRATVQMETEENTLSEVTNLLNRARELTIQGHSGNQNNETRQILAAEIRQLTEQLHSLTNTQGADGEYLFGGYNDQTAPFSKISGNFVYQGDQGQKQLQIGSETTVPITDSGNDLFVRIRTGNGLFSVEELSTNTGTGVIFSDAIIDKSAYTGHPYRISFISATQFDVIDESTGATVLGGQTFQEGDSIQFSGIQVAIQGTPATGDEFRVSPSAHQDLFTTMGKLATALETNVTNPGTKARLDNALNRSLSDIAQGLDHIIGKRATVGARMKVVEAQQTSNENYRLDAEKVISLIEDLDYPEAISRLNQNMLALQAAQQSFARIQELSLFNLL